MGFCVLVTCVLCAVYCCNVCIDVFTLDAGLLARCQRSEGPATGHLDTGFLSWFPCVFNLLATKLNPSVQRCLPRFLLRILIFKGLTARRLRNSFGIKGLNG